MTWNWEQPDWPNLTWDGNRLAAAEQQFLLGGGVLVGTVKHLGTEEREQLIIEAMSTEAVTTSEIEGEVLDRASVQSGASPATATRDLVDLTAKGALVRVGERRQYPLSSRRPVAGGAARDNQRKRSAGRVIAADCELWRALS